MHFGGRCFAQVIGISRYEFQNAWLVLTGDFRKNALFLFGDHFFLSGLRATDLSAKALREQSSLACVWSIPSSIYHRAFRGRISLSV